jgi:hypothetical protein
MLRFWLRIQCTTCAQYVDRLGLWLRTSTRLFHAILTTRLWLRTSLRFIRTSCTTLPAANAHIFDSIVRCYYNVIPIVHRPYNNNYYLYIK